LRSADPLRGAIVLLDPRSGRILTYAALTRSGRASELLGQATLPAASLFKLVTTAALFEKSSVSPRDRICISGGVRGIERRHLEPARGPQAECGPFAYALGHSKNAVFAQLATRWLSREDLLTTAERIGFNGRLSVDDQSSAELGRLSVPYNDLAFARTSAGFEGSTLSPLGAAYLATLIARGGERIGLRLHDPVPSTEAPSGLAAAPKPAAHELSPHKQTSDERAFSKRTADRLTRMLEVTVETGTSRAAFTGPDGRRYLKGIRVAGKTGTLRQPSTAPSTAPPTAPTAPPTAPPSELRSADAAQSAAGDVGESHSSMTSWFVGFAPSRSPEVVVTVLLVNGSVFRRKANEVARDLLRMYFRSHGRQDAATDPFEEPLAGAAPE